MAIDRQAGMRDHRLPLQTVFCRIAGNFVTRRGLSCAAAAAAIAVALVQFASDRAVAAPDVPLAAEDGGPRRLEVLPDISSLRIRAERSTASRIVGSYRGGQILWNLGCVLEAGRGWCDVQALKGGIRGYVAADYIRPAKGPDGAVPTGTDDSALRAGQGDFDATGTIPCAVSLGQPTVPCEFGVARGSGGDAMVVVSRPDGRKRALFFAHGHALSADTTEAEGPKPFGARKEADLQFISVGNERYEIPDAVILGG
ncbi:MAG: hypothetical protein ACMVY4_16570 [Minwuia sp.]|uniref:hypothetical protein n=1 Tax=Minwuia sp. TaxID=2493630 RepID=UPI003A86B232